MRKGYDPVSCQTRLYKKEAIHAAKELFYDSQVIAELKAAKTITEMERILVSARTDRRFKRRK